MWRRGYIVRVPRGNRVFRRRSRGGTGCSRQRTWSLPSRHCRRMSSWWNLLCSEMLCCTKPVLRQRLWVRWGTSMCSLRLRLSIVTRTCRYCLLEASGSWWMSGGSSEVPSSCLRWLSCRRRQLSLPLLSYLSNLSAGCCYHPPMFLWTMWRRAGRLLPLLLWWAVCCASLSLLYAGLLILYCLRS